MAILSRSFVPAVAAAIVLMVAGASRADEATPGERNFEANVAPIFLRHCVACHAADPKGGLDLTSRATAIKGGESGAALTPGAPDKSYLLERIVDGSMPPGKDALRPSNEEITAVRRWIQAGATWPAGRVLSPFEKTTDRRAGQDWWSLQPVVRPKLPAAADADAAHVRNPIDALVLHRLRGAGLGFAREADRRTLIRRLSLDLIGLPPSADDVESFVADPAPDAYERLVDRLLASPHYGERMGRQWLDIVRYTESDGFEQDKFRPHAWRYRDYVIRALNADKPYDAFVREQLAGDAMEPKTADGIMATGFLVAGPWDEIQNVGASALEKRRAHEEQVEELLGTISQTFLGLTVNCARCHDHKFDPIPQADYYRMKAVFDGVDHSLGKRDGNQPVFTPDELRQHEERLAPLKAKSDDLAKQIAALDARLPDVATADKDSGPIVAEGRFGTGLNARHARVAMKSKAAYRLPPLTVECWIKCGNPGTFNVFVAQNDKGAGDHWEIYSFAGKGDFSAYLPGYAPDTIRSDVAVADDKWHFVAMRFDGKRVQLHVDGKPAADVAVTQRKQPTETGELWIGGYGPQNIGCAGVVDDVRISSVIRPDISVPTAPLAADEQTVGLWTFDEAGTPRFSNRAVRVAEGDAPALIAQRDELTAALKKTKTAIDALVVPLAYVGHRRQPPVTNVLLRGDIKTPGAAVQPTGLTMIGEPGADFGATSDTPEADRRRRYAEWLTDPRHPLTARVMANRVWQAHFGEGLVSTPSDFGFNAGRPTNPELLDWLAAELQGSLQDVPTSPTAPPGGIFPPRAWSLKHLHRQIVTSTTYRQSAANNAAARQIDADNRLHWRFAPRRLDGETVRDAMLAVSGELNERVGGPSFEPWTVTVFNTHFYHLFDKSTPDLNRRTVYRASVITGRDPFLDSLDCPSPAVSTPRRRTTVTPLQALSLMNDSFVVRQAERFASRISASAGDEDDARIRQAVEVAFGRPAAKREVETFRELLKSHGLTQVCWVLLNSSEFLYLR